MDVFSHANRTFLFNHNDFAVWVLANI